MKKLVFIADISFKSSPRVRDQLIPEVVEDYAERYKKREQMPLPELAELSDEDDLMVCIDGTHRLHGLKQNGQKAATCNVTKMTTEEALKRALASNRAHGLRRSNDDKRRCVIAALNQWPDKTNVAISQLVGVDDKTVNVVRKEMEKNGALSKDVVRKDTTGREVKHGEARGKDKDDRLMDYTGYPIPSELRGMWEEGEMIKPLVESITACKSAIVKAQKENDILFVEVNFSATIGDLDKVFKSVQGAVPYAVCPQCQGRIASQEKPCVLCKGRGFISKFRFDTVVPDELKKVRAKMAKEAK